MIRNLSGARALWEMISACEVEDESHDEMGYERYESREFPKVASVPRAQSEELVNGS